jgi:hypothetical protein
MLLKKFADYIHCQNRLSIGLTIFGVVDYVVDNTVDRFYKAAP